MNLHLQRNRVYDLSTLNILGNKLKKNEYLIMDGVPVKITSQRYAVFKKSTKCVTCGLQATFLAAERDDTLATDKYHLNMYGVVDGEDILFTKDHIIPKSKGGANKLSNYQTMCTRCNSEKGNKC